MVVEKIQIDLEANTNNFERWLKDAEKFARDTWKELDPILKQDLELNVVEYEKKVKEARAQLKLLDDDSEEAIELKIDLNRYKRTLTEAKRELNNYLNTWDTATSRLQAKFNQVWEEIKKSRDELIKVWRSTAWIDKISNRLDELWTQLAQGKIDIRQYNKEIENLQTELQDSWQWFDWIITKLKGFWWALAGVTAVAWTIIWWITILDDYNRALVKLENQVWNTNRDLWELEIILQNINNTWLLQNLDEWVSIVSTLAKESKESTRALNGTAIWVTAIANTFDKDYNEVLRTNLSLQKTYWLTGAESNDIITSSLQRTWDTYDDLLDSINEYSAKAKDANIPVWQFVNTLIEWTNRWIRNTDELADTQREFAIRLVDWSKKSKQALKDLWIDFDTLSSDINSWATTVWEAMQDVANELINVDDKVKQNQLATDLLGTRYEDNWKIILDSIASANTELENYIWTTDTLVEKSDTWLTAVKWWFNALKNTLVDDVAPAFGWIWTAIWKTLKFFARLIEWFWIVKDVFALWIKTLVTWFVWLWETIFNFGKNAKQNLKVLWNNLSEVFKNIPWSLALIFNKAVKPIEDFVNAWIKWINKLRRFVWKTELDPVKLEIDTSWLDLPQFQSFVWIDNTTTKKLRDWLIKDVEEINDKIKDFKANTDWLSDSVEDNTKTTSENTKVLDDNTDSIDDNTEAEWNNTKAKEENEEKDKLFAEYQKKREEEKQKAYKKTYDTLKDWYEKAWDIIEDTIEKSRKSIEDFEKDINKLKEEISDLDNDINSLWQERAETLGQRNIEILEKQKDLESELKKIRESETTNESLQREKEINEELLALWRERQKIIENTTEEERKEAQRIAEQSPTERFLEELEIRQKDLEDQRAKKQEELLLLEEQKADEQAILEKFTNEKEQLDERYRVKAEEIESKITDDLIANTKARVNALEQVRLKALETASALREAQSLGAWWWTSTSVNNSRNTSIWTINVTDNSAVESLERTLNTEIN